MHHRAGLHGADVLVAVPEIPRWTSHYVSVSVGELDQEKLTPLLRLKYHDSIADAVADLGKPEEIGRLFSGFQKYLYQRQEAVA